MHEDPVPFNRGAISPMQCLREGWQLIKEQYWLFVGIVFVGSLIAGAGPMAILAGPMACGMYHCVFERMNGRSVEFSMLFKGFDWFVQCLVPALTMYGIAFVLIMGTYLVFIVAFVGAMAALAPQRGGDAGGALAGVMIGLYAFLFLAIMFIVIGLRTLFFFAFPLVMDRGLSGWEAVKMSMRAARGNLGGVIGVLLLLELIGLLSMALCCIGPILEMPLNLAMLAVAYRKVFPERDALARFDRDDDGDAPDYLSPRPGGDSSSTGVQESAGGMP